MTEKTISVGLGELEVSRDPSIILAAHGLGSCIGAAAYDPIKKIAGLAHVLLPDSTISRQALNKAKFADTAIPLLIETMIKQGATKLHLIIKIAGGARMFSIPGAESKMNIGQKNIVAVKEALQKLGLKISAEDTGGNFGRTLKIYTKDGRVFIRTTGFNEVEF